MSVYVNGELVLYGFVGESYWGEGFTAREVIDALAEHGRENDLIVHLNSGGGYTDDGLAIYNFLVAHKGNVRIEIDAMAASSASLIAMAGDEIIMRSGAMMMIHEPMSGTFGNADDHQKTLEMLERLAAQMASIYSDQTKTDAGAIRDTMKATHWLNAVEAVEQGFATSSDAGKLQAVAAYDYRTYAKAPDDLCALSKQKNWSIEAIRKASASADVPSPSKETPMAEQKDAAIKNASEIATKAAIAAAIQTDRTRRKDVLVLDGYKANSTLAESLLASTDMSVEEIKTQITAAQSDKATAAEDVKVPLVDTQSIHDQRHSLASGLGQPQPPKGKAGASTLSTLVDASLAKSGR